MSFMAVAYVPAFLEDRATFAKERANGLYGATPFMVSNFLIGLPFLCMLYIFPKTRISNRPYSPDLNFILDCLVLALELPPRRRRLFHLGHVDFPRPSGSRVPGRPRDRDLSKLCYCSCARGIC